MSDDLRIISFECCHADTCLPDYWCGHHLPHVSIPVWPGMTLEEIKRDLLAEVNSSAIAGNIPDQLTHSGYDLSEQGYDMMENAINEITPSNPEQTGFFNDLEMDEDGEYSVYAYFVFVAEYAIND